MSFPKWPSWRFGPGGQSAVFESEADVPKGWVDHPTKVKGEAKEPAPAKSEAKQPAKAPAAAGAPSLTRTAILTIRRCTPARARRRRPDCGG
jgi:hypothetical protein